MVPSGRPHEDALEHLRIIRTLMERAHIYRAVSAPAALFGGSSALVLSAYGLYADYGVLIPGARHSGFLIAWLTLLVLATVLNLGLLVHESKGRGQPIVTGGMRMALRAFIPPMFTGGFLSTFLVLLKHQDQLALAALVWILCYGLALQATASFAPRSIVLLGRAFLLAGIISTFCWFTWENADQVWRPEAEASAFLGLSFGLAHVIYAVAVFLSKAKVAAPVPLTE